MWRVLLATGFILLAAAPAFSQPRDQTAEVQAAVLRFFDGMERGDADLLVRSIFAMPDSLQPRARQTFAELVAAQRALERAVTARFPSEKKRLASGFELLITAADREAVRRSKVYVDEPQTARLEKYGETTSMRLRRFPGREWQVEIDFISNLPPDPGDWLMRRPDSGTRIRLDRMKAMADAYDQVAQRVEGNELATAAAVEADLIDRVNKIHQETARRQAALPERRFFRDGR